MSESKSSSEGGASHQDGSIANKDSATAVNSEATDTERDWAQHAHTEFNKGSYNAALTLLNKLEAARPKDIKVLLNKAVVEYYKSELVQTDKFRKSLSDICSEAKIILESVEGNEEVEASVIHLNHCMVLFHLRQYRTAMAILEKMYTGLESLEESVGMGVCLLLVECHLGAGQAERALAVITHTEATYLPQPLPPTPSPKQQPSQHDNKSPEKGVCTGGGGSSSSSSSSSISASAPSTNEEIHCSASQEQLRGKLQQLRVRSLLMMRALRVAKKELKTIVTQAVSAGNSLNVTLVSLKSQLEYLRGNHWKAIKVLNQCGAIPPPGLSVGPSLSIMYYNNLGLVHLGLGKPTLACLYLQKALQEVQREEDQGPPPSQEEPLSHRSLYQLGSNVKPELYYNLGITLLHMNKPDKAFDFLLEVLQVHPRNPRLWLRLAECCIQVHKNGMNEESMHKTPLQGTVGVGIHRKICLSTSICDHNKKIVSEEASTDTAIPETTLEFAAICLRNCLALLPENISTAPLTDDQEASGVLPELYSCGPSSPMHGPGAISLRVSALATSTYVALCLSDFPVALKHAEMLLAAHPKLPSIYKLLGHLYASEALIYLGRALEATNHLDPRLIENVPLGPQTSDPTQPYITHNHGSGCLPKGSSSLTSLQVMRYNLAVALTLRGELDKAANILKELQAERSSNFPPQFTMLTMYIQLQMGQVEMMKATAKGSVNLT